jgi:hypothetical protein
MYQTNRKYIEIHPYYCTYDEYQQHHQAVLENAEGFDGMHGRDRGEKRLNRIKMENEFVEFLMSFKWRQMSGARKRRK